MSSSMPPTVEQRLERLEAAIVSLTAWLVEAQSGLGERDVRGIEKILRGEK